MAHETLRSLLSARVRDSKRTQTFCVEDAQFMYTEILEHQGPVFTMPEAFGQCRI